MKMNWTLGSGSALALISILALNGCSHGDCHNTPQNPLAQASPSPSPAPAIATISTMQGTVDTPKAPALPTDAIMIYKPTGEKQCEPGTGNAVEQAQGELTAKNIPSFDPHTQADGLMHMSLCGAPAGNIHVFTISKKNLPRAERLGFKVLKKSVAR